MSKLNDTVFYVLILLVTCEVARVNWEVLMSLGDISLPTGDQLLFHSVEKTRALGKTKILTLIVSNSANLAPFPGLRETGLPFWLSQLVDCFAHF